VDQRRRRVFLHSAPAGNMVTAPLLSMLVIPAA
jgi:hypothetical protein